MKDRSTRTFQPFTAIRQGSKRLAAHTPTDLLGVTGFVVVAAALLVIVDVSSSLVRSIVGFPFLFLAPGYATVAALYPRASTDSFGLVDRRAVTTVERAALAFGLSIAVLPLLGLLIAAASLGFTTQSVVMIVGGYTLITSWIAATRRLRVPAGERYRLALGHRLGTLRAAIFDTRSSVHTAVNVLLVVSMLVALTTVGFALVSPQQDEQYTSLEVLTEDDSGELVASGQQSAIESGDSVPLAASIENQEGQDVEYTVVVQEQWIVDGDVVERNELAASEHHVADGETITDEQNVTPTAESGEVRIAVMLYAGDAPETPTTEDAYRYGHFWTEVVDGEGDSEDA